MKNEYFIVNKRALPNYFEKIVKINNLVNSGEKIIDACKIVGLARSTYYKYKDYVFVYNDKIEKKMCFSIKYFSNSDVLKKTIDILYNNNLEIVSLNKNDSVNGLSFIFITICINDNTSINNIVEEITLIPDVNEFNILSIE